MSFSRENLRGPRLSPDAVIFVSRREPSQGVKCYCPYKLLLIGVAIRAFSAANVGRREHLRGSFQLSRQNRKARKSLAF
jgi:hypothetical protein